MDTSTTKTTFAVFEQDKAITYNPTSVSTRVLSAILFVVLLIAGIVLEGTGFQRLRQMRQLERLPLTQIDVALPGEVRLEGSAQLIGEGVTAPVSGKECIYYRYVREREDRNSDGGRTWNKVDSRVEQAPFTLRDSTGTIRVAPSSETDFNLQRSFGTSDLRYRETEWRLDPGEVVTVVGYARKAEDGQLEVRFDVEGDYLPLVSENYNDLAERNQRAKSSTWRTLGGLACLSFSILGLCNALLIHRVIAYLGLLAVIHFGALSFFGFALMSNDLVHSHERLERQSEFVTEAIQSSLSAHGIEWSGAWTALGAFDESYYSAIPEAERNRLARLRLDLAAIQRRTDRLRSAFPERWLAPILGLEKIQPINLPGPEAQKLAVRESEFQETRLFHQSPAIGLGIIIGGFLAGLAGAWSGVRKIKIKRWIENLPTSPINGVAYGLAEINGFTSTLDGEEAVVAPLSNERCIYYRYIEYEREGSGKKGKWSLSKVLSHSQPCWCSDGDGRLKINSEGAEIIPRKFTKKEEDYRKFTETRIELGDRIYAIGHAGIDPETGSTLQLEKPDDKALPFILSNSTESEVMFRKGYESMPLLNVAICGLIIGLLLVFGMSGSFAPTNYLIAALCGLAFLSIITIVLHYNDLVFLANNVHRNWSNIDVSLKKRRDLMPNLVHIVQSYIDHEHSLQEEAVQLRNRVQADAPTDPNQASSYMQAEQQLTKGLLALMESNPNLKASEEVITLMHSLTRVENEIALMSKGYNDAVEIYNRRVQSFPDRILASLFAFYPYEFMTHDLEILEAPQIEFPKATPDISSKAPEETMGNTEPPSDVPDSLVNAARRPVTVMPVVFALLLSEDKTFSSDHLDILESTTTRELRQETESLLPFAQALEGRKKLETLDFCLATLSQLLQPDYEILVRTMDQLIRKDASISLFEYTVDKIVKRQYNVLFNEAAIPQTRHYSYGRFKGEISIILSFLAHLGGDEANARAAFHKGINALDEPDLGLEWRPSEDASFLEADRALHALTHLDLSRREKLIAAASAIVYANAAPNLRQLLFLRAIAESFYCAAGTGN